MKIFFYLIIVAAFIAVALSGCSAKPDVAVAADLRYKVDIPKPADEGHAVPVELSGQLPEFPDSAEVYKMVNPDITKEYVKELGEKFGLTGKITSGDENYLMSDEATRTFLEVYKATGTFRFSIMSKMYPDEPPVLLGIDSWVARFEMSFEKTSIYFTT